MMGISCRLSLWLLRESHTMRPIASVTMGFSIAGVGQGHVLTTYIA